jgi:hypothetical protein
MVLEFAKQKLKDASEEVVCVKNKSLRHRITFTLKLLQSKSIVVVHESKILMMTQMSTIK